MDKSPKGTWPEDDQATYTKWTRGALILYGCIVLFGFVAVMLQFLAGPSSISADANLSEYLAKQLP
jgi:hypothetical protein